METASDESLCSYHFQGIGRDQNGRKGSYCEISKLAQKRSLQFFTNRPLRWEWPAWLLSHPFEGDFDIAPKLRGFFSNFDSYRVAASYIDETGAAILSKALERGAHIELVMPWTPNVYADCNARKDDVGWGWMGYKNTLKTKSQ